MLFQTEVLAFAFLEFKAISNELSFLKFIWNVFEPLLLKNGFKIVFLEDSFFFPQQPAEVLSSTKLNSLLCLAHTPSQHHQPCF